MDLLTDHATPDRQRWIASEQPTRERRNNMKHLYVIYDWQEKQYGDQTYIGAEDAQRRADELNEQAKSTGPLPRYTIVSDRLSERED